VHLGPLSKACVADAHSTVPDFFASIWPRMKDDIRYSEFKFIRAIDKRDPKFQYINANNSEQQGLIGLHQILYTEMIVALAEDRYIEFDNDILQPLIGRLRGEIALECPAPRSIQDYEWRNPRAALHYRIIGASSAFGLRTTYRGMCRLEELRDLLKRDRILDPFGVLLDIRYLHRDLEDALRKSPEIPVSLVRLDLDGFKSVNDTAGHLAGDVVLTRYLETVRDCLGSLGDGYRAGGDEVVAIVIGQNHERVAQIAEKMRLEIETMKCKFKDAELPRVTASIGVATSPPDKRDLCLQEIADARQIHAKRVRGKNCVISN
jgi:diguanylate cyclase (GGDEF)-like protein